MAAAYPQNAQLCYSTHRTLPDSLGPLNLFSPAAGHGNLIICPESYNYCMKEVMSEVTEEDCGNYGGKMGSDFGTESIGVDRVTGKILDPSVTSEESDSGLGPGDISGYPNGGNWPGILPPPTTGSQLYSGDTYDQSQLTCVLRKCARECTQRSYRFGDNEQWGRETYCCESKPGLWGKTEACNSAHGRYGENIGMMVAVAVLVVVFLVR